MIAKKVKEIDQVQNLDISNLSEEYQDEMRRLYDFFLKQQKKESSDKTFSSW